MTDKEVYEALLAGKRLTLPSWTSKEYWEQLNENGILVDNLGGETELSPAKNYTLYEEPKKCKVLYYVPSIKEYGITDTKYSDEQDFNTVFNEDFDFVLLLKEQP